MIIISTIIMHSSLSVSLPEATAYIFDLNGTMINDMPYHVKAWHDILNGLGAGISMERMKEECYGKNQELLERTFPERFTTEEKNRMSLEKEKTYQREYRPFLELLPGLEAFLENARRAGIKMAIGSAAIMFNIDFVLDNLHIRHYFDALVSADEVNRSKPDPETFLRCAQWLAVDPASCIVFEDSPKGVDAAARAGMPAFVLTTMHRREEFSSFSNVIGFGEDFRGLDA